MDSILAAHWKSSARAAITECPCRGSRRVTPRTTVMPAPGRGLGLDLSPGISLVEVIGIFALPLKVYLIGVVSNLSLVSRTKTASSLAGSVLLSLRLIEWIAPGGSDQLSPAR